jgi:hypothetical protein
MKRAGSSTESTSQMTDREKTMEQHSIEEKLKVIEAAINLTQQRNLPVVIRSGQPMAAPKDGDHQDAGRAREVALAVLKRFDERIVRLEQDGTALAQDQERTETIHREHQEAIELISSEVAALKHRSAQMEGWLRHAHQIRPAVELFEKERRDMHKGYGYLWFVVGALIVMLLIWVNFK